jgi:hypothetical protein
VRVLRANPRYELVLFDRLAPDERRALAGLEQDDGLYGVLRPRGAPGPAVRSADRETALLFLTLREPGPLPSYVRRVFGEPALREIERLIADGVFEVENDGVFVSGPAALGLLQGATEPAPAGRIARLSLEALRHAQALAEDDPAALALRLYGYNSRPLTPRWRRLLSGPEAVQDHLGIGPGGPHRWVLDRKWKRLDPSAGWLSWAWRSGGGRRPGSSPTYKLYISPEPESLAERFDAILAGLTMTRPFQFKIGSDAWGLLRPDKIVAYFPDFERLAEAAGGLAEGLSGVPAQGVPFTAEIDGDGLLSWGIDSSATESWRFWLVRKLARALLTAREAGEAEPWRFALDRLRLEGIDTATWTPGSLLWR